ncbi:hypothetical protein LAZ67_6003648 [Cordylochernes scorpioides]|uniref:Transposase n=1 Tax=Cordylochernes scorpioides TaxID=51811 RepID=A0ABY6KNQ2_9ARAC|nr:hypothetical protein LAZ67_6003648 [Cordylochernes scorpioides]
MDNLQQSTREMSARLGPSKDTINRTLYKLRFVSKRPRQDPHDLIIAQSQVASRYLWIVTVDEKWIYLRNLDTRRQWVSCDQEAKPVVKQDRFEHKAMLSVWWIIDVNADLYSEQLSRVYKVLKTQYPALINRNRVLLKHDNAPAHRDRLTTNRIKDLAGIEVLLHPINMKIILSSINSKMYLFLNMNIKIKVASPIKIDVRTKPYLLTVSAN